MPLSQHRPRVRFAEVRTIAQEVLALEDAQGRAAADQVAAQVRSYLNVAERDVLSSCLHIGREDRAQRRVAEFEVDELLQAVGAAAELLGLPEETTVASALEMLGFDTEHDLLDVTPAAVLVRAVQWRRG